MWCFVESLCTSGNHCAEKGKFVEGRIRIIARAVHRLDQKAWNWLIIYKAKCWQSVDSYPKWGKDKQSVYLDTGTWDASFTCTLSQGCGHLCIRYCVENRWSVNCNAYKQNELSSQKQMRIMDTYLESICTLTYFFNNECSGQAILCCQHRHWLMGKKMCSASFQNSGMEDRVAHWLCVFRGGGINGLLLASWELFSFREWGPLPHTLQ